MCAYRNPHSSKQSPVGWVPSQQFREDCDQIMAHVDPLAPGTQRLEGRTAVEFLKRSGLDKDVLRQIWLISDYNKQGYLGLDEFAVACRLISMVQNGKPATLEGLRTFSWVPLPLPVFQGINDQGIVKPPPAAASASAAGTPAAAGTARTWAITPQMRERYEGIFMNQELDENGQLVPGRVAPILQGYGLDMGVLKRIWDLASIEKANGLDMDEFCIALRLAEGVAQQGLPLPMQLPPELHPDTAGATDGLGMASLTNALPEADTPQSQPAASLGTAPAQRPVSMKTSAQSHADALLAAIDAEEAAREKAKQDAIQKEIDAKEARLQAEAYKKLKGTCEGLAQEHRRLLQDFQYQWILREKEASASNDLTEQTERVRSLVNKYKTLLHRAQNERISLKSEQGTLQHRLANLERDYTEARQGLVQADTEVQSLRYELEEMKEHR